jgi:pyruvate kinase
VRRANIVCTLGPATETPEAIRALVDAGMDVARMNCSHGTHDEHQVRFDRVRAAAEATGKPVAILVDLQGPKIRLGKFADGPVELVPGAEFIITTDDVPGDESICSTTHKGLTNDTKAGDVLLIDDGNIKVEVVRVEGANVVTKVVEGGKASNNKGINLPGAAVSVPAMSDKDEDDLRWGLQAGADVIALSFVRSGKDADPVRAIMDELGIRRPVIAKLEKPQAVDNLDDIVRSFDGVMVARGDLGVELPLWEVPLVQKRAIELCRKQAKPVIVATQMFESMITNSRPTRAEASDVANAILDGADCVMLSGETSVGAYPVEAVRTMARVVEYAEDHGLERIPPLGSKPATRGGVISAAAAEVAQRLGARYLVAFTDSGDTARRLSRLRAPTPIMAFTTLPETQRRLMLTWGVEAFLIPFVESTDEMVLRVEQRLIESGHAHVGDVVVLVAGSPPGSAGSTNALRVHRLGDAVTHAEATGMIPTVSS